MINDLIILLWIYLQIFYLRLLCGVLILLESLPRVSMLSKKDLNTIPHI